MPRASIADAIVFAVYIPPHAPGPGQACRTTSNRSSSVISSAAYAPEYAFKRSHHNVYDDNVNASSCSLRQIFFSAETRIECGIAVYSAD